MSFESMTLCVSHSPGFARDEAEDFGNHFRQGIEQAKRAVEKFDPTLVIFFGSDHRRAFQEILPSISVVYAAEGLGDLRSPTGMYNVPLEIAQLLAHGLVDEGFDVAVTKHIALDHGFGLTCADILGGIGEVPLVPIFINCATAPLGKPSRSVQLGRTIGGLLSHLEERVLFIGSGGLSHNPPTLALVADGVSEEERRRISAEHREAAMDQINPSWDEKFLRDLQSADDTWAMEMTQADIDPAGVGANEVRTWLAAYAAGGQGLVKIAYEPVREWLTGVGIAVSNAQGS